MEDLSADMEAFTKLHKDLDTLTGQSTTLLVSGGGGKCEDLIEANKNVWDVWWANKLKSNMAMLAHAKKGNYEEVAKGIDWHYNDDDQVASINFQEPGTGFTATHYAAQLGYRDLLNLLLASSADVMVPDAKG